MKPGAVHKKRLLKLADFLETVPRRQFDFGTWAEELFGLTCDEVDELFVPGLSSNPLDFSATPKQVAKHIRKFVAAQS